MRISDWSSDVCSSDLKLSLATPQLPTEVQLQGIRVAKATKNFLVVVGFVSTDDSMDRTDISDYIVSHVQDPISRTAGVGDYQVFGSQYAMRIWLDPAKLNSFQLTPVDVKNEIGRASCRERVCQYV